MMEKLLVLGAPIFQVEIIRKAKELGYYVGVVDVNADAPAFPYADETFICSIKDCDAVLDIAKKFKPNGIMIGACDTSVVTGAYVCDKLNLPGHSMDTAVKSTDKVKMLEAFSKKDVPHPAYQVVKKDSVESYKNEIPFPIITKPVDSSGGRGIFIVHSESELSNALKFSSEAGSSGDVLIEEYMQGPEVSVEILVVDGVPHVLQITDKLTSGEPHFFEIGHSQPSVLSDHVKAQIRDIASKAVLATGIDNSPAHVEIIITKDGPKMVELGARLGGDCITSYLIDTSVSGINMMESAIRLSTGKQVDVSNFTDSGICSAIRFIPARKGVLRSINGVHEAEKMPGVIKVTITGKVDREYTEATDDSERFGYVVCRGESTQEALRLCQDAIEKIDFELA